ncbi:hypothetical protein OF83DRAFT_212540 [Amylostereum chailletii]|nr:hypothetical protein OF83DRAFT_212540 [Amylostereum chailletii]
MFEPTMQRKARNRISLILQLGSSGKSQERALHSSKSKNASSPTNRPSLSSSPRQSNVTGIASAPSSSHDHVPSSPTLVPYPNSIAPITTNELDAHEKRRLLRQTRKLSQIFGEMPAGIVQEERGPFGRHPANLHEHPPVPPRSSSRQPSSRSILPSLQIPPVQEGKPASVSPLTESLSPLTFAPPVPPLPTAVSSPSAPVVLPHTTVADAPSTTDSDRVHDGRRSIPVDPRRASGNHRGGLKPVKLEEQSSSSLSIRPPIDSPTSPTRSQSARRALSKAKWQSHSVDVNPLPPLISTTRPKTASNPQRPTTSSSAHSTAGERSLQKSRSLWLKKGVQKLEGADTHEQDLASVIKDLKENGPSVPEERPMSRQQRSASVKKARKLNQVRNYLYPPTSYADHGSYRCSGQNRHKLYSSRQL